MIMNKIKMNSLMCKKLLQKAGPIIFRRKAHDAIDLKQIVYSKIQNEQKKVLSLRKKHGNKKIGDVTLNMVYGGMRGLLALVTETSLLDPEKGITFRGYTIPELKQKIPRARDGSEPLPEGMFWLLLTGDVPTFDQVDWLSVQWAKRAKLPDYVIELLETMPITMHPMTQLSIAVASMNVESKFAQAYSKGVPKSQYWEHTYEDVMDLIGRLTSVAAIIYKNTYKGGEPIPNVLEDKDWGYNFAIMLGHTDPAVAEMLRLYLSLHCDHEGGNVSAHTTHLVGSALSDPYLSYSAGLNGLAGPLHGLANQEVLIFLNKMQKQLGDCPNAKDIKKYLEDTLKSGQVIPGYGHAVLRKTDPRFHAQKEFCERHFPDDKLFKLVKQIYEVAPGILKATGKVQNPYPNVDAHSGVLLQYYGIKEMNYYTVLFGVSRCLGVSCCLVWDRALGLAIERPKSITTEKLIALVNKATTTDVESSEIPVKTKLLQF